MVTDEQQRIIPPPTDMELAVMLEHIYGRIAAKIGAATTRRFRWHAAWLGVGAGVFGLALGAAVTGAALSPWLQLASSSAFDAFSATCHSSIDPAEDHPVRDAVQRTGQSADVLAQQIQAARMSVLADCAQDLRSIAFTMAYTAVLDDYTRQGVTCGTLDFAGGGGIAWQPGSNAEGQSFGTSSTMWPPGTTPGPAALPDGCQSFSDVPPPAIAATPSSLIACLAGDAQLDVYPGVVDQRADICAARGQQPYIGGEAPYGTGVGDWSPTIVGSPAPTHTFG